MQYAYPCGQVLGTCVWPAIAILLHSDGSIGIKGREAFNIDYQLQPWLKQRCFPMSKIVNK